MAIALRKTDRPAAYDRSAAAQLTTAEVWREVDRASFAVVGYATPSGESRSSGVVYKTVGRRLYFAVAPNSWKARHIASSHQVSVTVPVRRGGVLALLWPIPPATVSFHATAIVHAPGAVRVSSVSKELAALVPAERLGQAVVIEVVPHGDFLTYGVGVSLASMRKPELAGAIVPAVGGPGENAGRSTGPGVAIYAFMALALAGAIAEIWLPLAGIVAVIAAAAALVGARRAQVKHSATRLWIFGLESFIALTAIQGGAGLLRESYGLPLSWLSGSFFSDYTVPGLALLIVVGGSSVLAAATVFVERRWAVVMSGLAGVFMAGYEVVEILSIDRNAGSDLPVVLALQLLWLAVGAAVATLSGLLWTREYRRSEPAGLATKEVIA